MGENSAIDWCDHSFNPWIGCAKVSPGCAHCYAETLVTGRMNRPGTWGEDGVRQRTSASTWKQPGRWERRAERFYAEHGRRQRVFCASLADVFEPRPELEWWRRDLFEHVIAACPSLDWLILTKRPDVARDWLTELYDRSEDSLAAGVASASWPPLPNVWIGTSIENSRHTYRADVLRDVPAAVRFISAEPLLGSLFEPPRWVCADEGCSATSDTGAMESDDDYTHSWERSRSPLDLTGIDWVIVGGESGGRDARPMHPAWAHEIRNACLTKGEVTEDDGLLHGDFGGGTGDARSFTPRDGRPAFFFKQWGSWSPAHDDEEVARIANGHPSGRYLDGAWVAYRGSGPKSGGKVLDGREWCEFPESRAPVPA